MNSIGAFPESPGSLTAVGLSLTLAVLFEMAEPMTHEPVPEAHPAAPRRPYVTPVLKVFGAVAGMTGTRSPSGSLMDGGPNNSKT